MATTAEFRAFWASTKKGVVEAAEFQQNHTAFRTLFSVGKWKIAIRLILGPRLGVTEEVWIYDSSDPGHNALKWDAAVPADYNFSLVGIRELRKNRRKHGKNRAAAKQLCREALKQLLEDKKSPLKGWWMEQSIESFVTNVGQSVSSLSGGLPGLGKSR